MNKFILIAFLINILNGKAQITGVITYSVGSGNNYNAWLRQQISQKPNGDIFLYDPINLQLLHYSSGTFTTHPMSFSSGFSQMNTYAGNNGVWCYSKFDEVYFFNGTTFTDYSSNVVNLVGTLSTTTNQINYIAEQGSNVYMATKTGIIKFDGINFTLINKSNSNLNCDTVNCICYDGTTMYVGTDKGLCTYNGTAFSPLIQFTGAPSHKVNYIFSNGVKTIVTRTDNSSVFNVYRLNSNQLVRMPAFADSTMFHSGSLKSMAFISNNPVFTSNNNGVFRIASSANTFSTYVISMPSTVPGQFVFPDPLNPNKFYTAGTTNTTAVSHVDIQNYSNYGPSFNNDETKYLDTNQVRALIGETSIKHWDIYGNGTASYEVPKGSGKHANFASSLWIGGLDNSNQLHLAGETYRQNGIDFWPGPLDTITGVANSLTGAPFNKIWKFSCNQINQFVVNANAANFSANNSPSFADINSYIANGTSTNNFAQQLAPFKDWNNDGLYDPSQGEYPIIKGHQMIYSVFNDNYAQHTETKGLPLGVEIHERSYSYNFPLLPDSMQVINYSTFYNYEIYNRSNNNYNNVYLTFWSDCDLGYYLNDFVGTDTINGFGYVYNGATNDPTGYGSKLPMLGFAVMPQPSAQYDGIDNNNNGIIDELNENFKLGFVTYYNNNIGSFAPATVNPNTKWQYYNYMSGRWKDSSFFKPIGSAYNPTINLAPTNYVYTGNPQTNSGWTEGTAGMSPGDKRILVTIGPFNFTAKKKIEFEYSLIFSRDTSLNNVNNNLSLLQRDVRNTKYFCAQQNTPACAPPVYAGIRENSLKELNVWIYPNPTTSDITVNLDHNAIVASIKVIDIIGRRLLEYTVNNTYTKIISLASLTPGVYFIEVSDGPNRKTIKVIKE
jgi:hypothetical protein